jgi:outer membrane protein assembly factor BamB
MVSQAAPRAVTPPWTLHWETSPIWFERWNAAGLSESPSRRIAVTDKHVLTVARRTLYFLDKTTGRTDDSLELIGNEIFDWMVVGGYVVYASWDWNTRNPIHGAVELTNRKAAWVDRDPGRIDLPEWIVPLDRGTLLFGSDSDGPASGQFVALDLRSGVRRWALTKTFALSSVIPRSWFVYGRQLLGLLSSREGGLRLARFDASDGRELSSVDLVKGEQIGNFFQPRVVGDDGTLIIGYNKITRPERRAVMAFDARDGRALWNVSIAIPPVGESGALKRVLVGPGREPVVATMWPNRVIALDRETGAIKGEVSLPGYVGWTEPNALLYSYPYVFTSARRVAGSGMAYDLIAINIEEMRIAWSYEISKQPEAFLTARAEILNFVPSEGLIFVARADSRVMAFRPSSARP